MRKWIALGFIVAMMLVPASGCGKGTVASDSTGTNPTIFNLEEWKATSTTAAPAATTTENSIRTAECGFMAELTPAIASFVGIISRDHSDSVEIQATYNELHRLSSEWSGRSAPSERTAAVLTEWLPNVQAFEQGFELLAAGNPISANAIFENVNAAEHAPKLIQMLGDIDRDLGIPLPAQGS